MECLKFDDVKKRKGTINLRSKIIKYCEFIKKEFDNDNFDFSYSFEELKSEKLKSGITLDRVYYKKHIKDISELINKESKFDFTVDTINYRGRVYFKITKK